jgi:hypothetical protein
MEEWGKSGWLGDHPHLPADSNLLRRTVHPYLPKFFLKINKEELLFAWVQNNFYVKEVPLWLSPQ